MIADQFLESGLWTMLWTRVSQSLKPELDDENPTSSEVGVADHASSSSASNKNNNETASSSNAESLFDWTFISPSGYLSLLELASRMLTVSTQNCAALVLRDDSLMFDTLSCMLAERFLVSVKKW